MRIDCSNYTKQNTSFGYFLPEYCDSRQNMTTQELLHEVAQQKRAESKESYEEYMNAIDNFRRRRFDATELKHEYEPQIKECGRNAVKSYNKYLDRLDIPVCEGMDLVTQTREVKIKEKPLKRLLNFLQGKKPQTETITERVKKPVQFRDLSRMNATVTGVIFERLGKFINGRTPVDYFSLKLETGKGHQLTIDKTKAAPDYIESLDVANKKFQKMLSSAEGLNELGDKIDECIKDDYESHCKWILHQNRDK